jgi:hypothetical protein
LPESGFRSTMANFLVILFLLFAGWFLTSSIKKSPAKSSAQPNNFMALSTGPKPAATAFHLRDRFLISGKEFSTKNRVKPVIKSRLAGNEDPSLKEGDIEIFTPAVSNDNAEVSEALDSKALEFSFSSPATPPVQLAEGDDPLGPYVPNNSFSYQIPWDTNAPHSKAGDFHDKQARESKLKAQKALAAVDWKKIEHTLKLKGKDIQQLKVALDQEMAKLDWKRINDLASQELNKDQVKMIQTLKDQVMEMQNFQQQQTYLKAMEEQIQEKERLLKAGDRYLEEIQKNIEEKQKKLDLELKKKKIIFI